MLANTSLGDVLADASPGSVLGNASLDSVLGGSLDGTPVSPPTPGAIAQAAAAAVMNSSGSTPAVAGAETTRVQYGPLRQNRVYPHSSTKCPSCQGNVCARPSLGSVLCNASLDSALGNAPLGGVGPQTNTSA